VTVPFGRGNRRCEGVVLAVDQSEEAGLKAVEQVLDEEPVVSGYHLRMAAFVRERYFCTFYDAIRAILPAGVWYQTRAFYSLTADRSWKEKTIRKLGRIGSVGMQNTDNMILDIMVCK
jgi:primosomal protein N' (replication factor Y)